MDEYFCPNCGAVLNDQSGFDPDGGTWTCTECGTLLMDDDVYDGDSFQGVAWYCDSCGALLNRQHGFSDSYETWTCTECGYENGITEEDIIEDNKKCPSCGANLKKQSCYSEYDDDWECTECGAHLHHDYTGDPYEVVEDDEDDDSDEDDEYEDNEDDDSDEDDEYEDNEDDDSDEDDDYEDSDDKDEEFVNTHYYYPNSSTFKKQSYESTKTSEEWHSKKQKKPDTAWTRFVRKLKRILRIICIMSVICFISYYEIKQLTPVKYSSVQLEGKKYTDVMTLFQQAGFKYISATAIEDLEIDETSKENTVLNVKIAVFESFDEGSKFPANFPITIRYHAFRTVKTPMSSKEAKKQNYKDVKEAFEEAGFTSVKVEVDYDIITGWLAKEEEVDTVTIDGNKKFDSDDKYLPNVDVVITYHDLRKNKPE